MARTAIREQAWSVNGNMSYQGNKEMSYVSTSTIASRRSTRSVSRSRITRRNLANERLSDEHSTALQNAEREVLYYSPGTSGRISDINEQNDNFVQEQYLVQNDSNDSIEELNCSGYLLMWRKCLYFILSKPVHYDVEILSQIKSMGKKKVISLILLPFLLYLLYSAFAGRRNSLNILDSDQISSFSSTLGSEYNDASSLTMGVIDNEDENLPPVPFHDDSESSFSWSSLFTPFFSSTPSAENIHTTVHETKSTSNINMSEVEVLVRRIILEDPDSLYFLNNHQKHNSNMQKEINALHTEFLNLQSEFKKLKENMNSNHNEELHVIKEVKENSEVHKIQFAEFDNKMHNTEEKLVALETSLNNLKNCCSNDTKLMTIIEHNTRLLLHSLMTDKSDSSFPDLKEWLYSKFATKEMVEKLLMNSMTSIKDHEKESEIAITETLKKHFETLSESRMSSANENVILHGDATEIEILIHKAILLYDADKTGQTDYALESGGGSIVNTRCSETFTEHSARISILGFPLWHLQNSPRNAIQPSVHPGECWAFKGSQGYLVIQLATIIKPTGFVVEHIPKSISSSGNIDSAPKDFSVHGLMSEKDFEGELLGKYSYDKDGEPLQYFPVEAQNVLPYRYIELKIHSNHGNGNYTCLYRFRVHGFRH